MRVSTAMPVSGVEEHRDFGLAQVPPQTPYEEMMKIRKEIEENNIRADRERREYEATFSHRYRHLLRAGAFASIEGLLAYLFYGFEKRNRLLPLVSTAAAVIGVGILGHGIWNHFHSRSIDEQIRLLEEKWARERAAALPPASPQ